ncbi:polyprenyl synthetase family protein [Luteimonas sp. BDR2-5]|uniref:polyprenyl synthetase family protein n=1 Tax=Proluteimonas luteida TaxID=2878685 RepID=UPI001E56AB45|nr:farnesyl diphosphate synthase [Luteimonas sp. BDR2-5]MCD9028104.1 polyprenyl synthetase family protein [Luteimonas sp. BDR2-5]
MPDAPMTPAGAPVDARIAGWRTRTDIALQRALDTCEGGDPRLLAAMRHAVLLGGKRMRPLLVHATAHALGAAADAADAPATAVELVHAYSLVHDDLPAMDDDALRRGQPTVHVAFDEATAILAGDALQTLAFSTLAAGTALPDAARLQMVAVLAEATGASGMCGGQALDIAATGAGTIGLPALERLHALKTGALLRASVTLGALAAGVDASTRARLDTFAGALGLAFQIRDDLLDIEGDSHTLGKTAGKDVAQDKATFPALIGVDGSRRRLAELAQQMHDALASFGPASQPLAELGRRAIERDH